MTSTTTCGCCGNETLPPYTGTDGHRYEGHYCGTCGAYWSDPAAPAPGSCLIHRDI